MKTQRWQRIQALFENALALPIESRRRHVQSSCGDDPELCDEVISLLEAHDRGGTIEGLPTAWILPLTGPTRDGFSPGDHVARRYRIERLLGRGGMGVVYEAWDEELSIRVALKTLTNPARSDDALRRLKLEGLLARSVWHPNVCRVYDVGRHGTGKSSEWFLSMELLQGETLAERLEREKRLAPQRALLVAEQMAEGLGAAHRAGVVHCDFKPSNVMLVRHEDGEQAIVTDFGTARTALRPEIVRERGFAAVGTPAYMSPEQVRGDEVGPATDIYAFGMVLYEMITGGLPFGRGSTTEIAMRRLEQAPPSPRRIVPDLDERWERAILRAIALEPSQRFGRAEEVIEALTGQPRPAEIDGHEPGGRERRTLPAQRDEFVGREAEIESLSGAFSGYARLVTLTGAGGMGKTRLAIQYGRRTLGQWPGGVIFCDLTEARDMNAMASTVAVALGIRLERGNAVAQLGHAIAGRERCLLILDNFEQITVHAAATIGLWLKRAREARCLVTSRERLGLDGEHVHTVDPLSIETGLELFIARARALRPALELLGEDARAAREIVRLVDGMPLAIELAAARMRVLSASEIASRMRKRFRLLTGGRSAHHETLEGTIDDSWELLNSSERSAWAQCSVFEGGFTLRAAEAVLDLGKTPDAPWVVDVLQSLVDKSLVRNVLVEAGSGEPEPRFGMYVSLQEYARARLEKREATSAEERHGAWFARSGGDEALEDLETTGGIERWRRIAREIDNLAVACWRAKARGDGATTAATYRALCGVLKLRGPFDAVIELGREALSEVNLGRCEAAHILHALGEAEYYAGMYEEAGLHLESAVAIAREVGDTRLAGRILTTLGWRYQGQSKLEEADSCLSRALEIARDVGDRRNEGIVLNTLGLLHHMQGEIEQAREFHEAGLLLARSVGDRRTEGVTLSNLGILHQHLGGTDAARAFYEAALAIHAEIGNRRSEAIAHLNLGSLDTDLGRMAEARANLEAALTINRDLGARRGEGIALTALGELLADQEQDDAARMRLEEALVIHREIGDRSSEGVVLGNLGRLLHRKGRDEEARTQYEAALAVLREVGDRRYEGYVLTNLGLLLAERGAIESARTTLGEAEEILREIDARVEMGKLLCARAELEWREGNVTSAMNSLEEARGIAIHAGSGPDSELGRMLARAGRSVGIEPQGPIQSRSPG